jgi:4-amino-4-deoxy-L-arabinose transferase-like glycosyltransferase
MNFRSISMAVLAAVVLYVCLFSRLDALGLVGPDEPRYAAIARDMSRTGDWVTPRLNGRPWFEKPVLYYWLAGASFRLFGVSEVAARLPSAICAALALLAMSWLAGKLQSGRAAMLALLLGCTCAGIIGFSRAATTDMPFSAMMTLALAAACRILWPEKFDSKSAPDQRASRVALAVFGVSLGLATLAKGPVALVLAGGGALLWAACAQRWKDALRLARPISVAAWAGVALPWYVLCAARNPEFVQVFLIAHNVERFFTPVFQHVQPFWFFGPILLLGLAPWALPLAVAAGTSAKMLRQPAERNTPQFFLVCWVVFIIVFFSISKSKLPGYILPTLFPLAALLAGWLAAQSEARSRKAGIALAGAGFTFAVLAASAQIWIRRLPDGLDSGLQSEVSAGLIALAAGGMAIAALALLRSAMSAILSGALLAAGAVMFLNARILPRLDAQLSPRAAARAVESAGAAICSYRLHRAWQYGLDFYLGRELPACEPSFTGSRAVITSRAGREEIRAAGIRVEELKEISRQAILLRVQDKNED